MAAFANGALTIGRVAGVWVRIHWTALFGAFVFTGFAFDSVRWACYFGLILAHELGHALVVKAARATALSIEVTGYGGVCWWQGNVSPIARACIAWGGVWAQIIVLIAALIVQPPFHIMWALTVSNAWLIAVNLLPIEPLDGAAAWRLPFLLGRSLRARMFSNRNTLKETADEDFSSRRDEVDAIVSGLLESARKEEPK